MAADTRLPSAALSPQLETGCATEEEYLDVLLKNIRNAPAAGAFLECVYQQFYDPDREKIKVATPPEAELREAFRQVVASCQQLQDPVLSAQLAQLTALLSSSSKLLLLRWGLARLVGMALNDRLARTDAVT